MFHKNTRHFLFVACTILINTHVSCSDNSNSTNNSEKNKTFTTNPVELDYSTTQTKTYQLTTVISFLNKVTNFAECPKNYTTLVKKKPSSGSSFEYSGLITVTFIPSQQPCTMKCISDLDSKELFNAIKTFQEKEKSYKLRESSKLPLNNVETELKEASQKIHTLHLALIKIRP